jgi:cell division protein FtsL
MIRLINLIAFIVAAALAVALYLAKTEAQGAQERLAELQAQLAEERRQINVLNVEVAHLEDPERMRALARRYLGYEPLDPARQIEFGQLPMVAQPGPGATVQDRSGLLVRQGDGTELAEAQTPEASEAVTGETRP